MTLSNYGKSEKLTRTVALQRAQSAPGNHDLFLLFMRTSLSNSLLNHSIKKWSDMTSPFILNDMFHSILECLQYKKMVTKKCNLAFALHCTCHVVSYLGQKSQGMFQKTRLGGIAIKFRASIRNACKFHRCKLLWVKQYQLPVASNSIFPVYFDVQFHYVFLHITYSVSLSDAL